MVAVEAVPQPIWRARLKIAGGRLFGWALERAAVLRIEVEVFM